MSLPQAWSILQREDYVVACSHADLYCIHKNEERDLQLSIPYKHNASHIPRLGAWYCGIISIKQVSLNDVKRHILAPNCI